MLSLLFIYCYGPLDIPCEFKSRFTVNLNTDSLINHALRHFSDSGCISSKWSLVWDMTRSPTSCSDAAAAASDSSWRVLMSASSFWFNTEYLLLTDTVSLSSSRPVDASRATNSFTVLHSTLQTHSHQWGHNIGGGTNYGQARPVSRCPRHQALTLKALKARCQKGQGVWVWGVCIPSPAG